LEESYQCLSGKGGNVRTDCHPPNPFHPPLTGRKERHMNTTTANVPDDIRREARDRALKVIEANKGCISYVRPEDLETATLFIPIVTAILPVKQEFHEFIPGIGIMPRVPLMNRIREAAGVNITRTDTVQESEDVWVATSYGEKRMPDGTMLPDNAVYEFSAKTRAERDYIKDGEQEPAKRKYTTDIAKQKHLLELRLFGRSKAETGAQLRLIAKLAKIERSFKTEADLLRGMILWRVDRNVNGVLADPGLRQAALGQMLGATDAVFGPQAAAPLGIEMRPEPTTPPAAAEQPAPADDWDERPPEPDPVTVAKDQLRGYLQKAMPAKGVSEINAILDNQAATLQDVSLLIDRCEAYLQLAREKRRAV
jgi:hypothetical protein